MRISKHLRQCGIALSIEAADAISLNKLTADVYLISKVHDIRAILIMTAAKAQNKVVGVDFFDNYFETTDARLQRLRDWVVDVAQLMDFALCATVNMKAVLERELLGNTPCLIVNDPYHTFEPDRLCGLLEDKLARLKHTGILRVSWFGIAGNSYFPVGIHDLVAFRDQLTPLRSSRYQVRLTVMSNFRGQSNPLYAMLAKMTVPVEIIEWSEEGESALLESSLLSFIPVNAQGFSTVKSLNRAISALTGGAQVLSAGFPIYQPLAPFIYRDARTLLRDIETEQLLLRPETLADLSRLFESLGDPKIEAEQLANFVKGLVKPATAKTSPKSVVVVGRRTPPGLLEYAQKQGQLVIATPFSRDCKHFDGRIVSGDNDQEASLQLLPSGIKQLAPALKGRLIACETPDNSPPVKALLLRNLVPAKIAEAFQTLQSGDRGPALIDYAPAMTMMTSALKQAFPDNTLLISEWEAPFTTNRRLIPSDPGTQKTSRAKNANRAIKRRTPQTDGTDDA